MPSLDAVNVGILLSGGVTGTFFMSFSSSKSATEFFFIGTKVTLSMTDGLSGSNVELDDVPEMDANERDCEQSRCRARDQSIFGAVAFEKAELRASPEEALNDLAVIESLCLSGVKLAL